MNRLLVGAGVAQSYDLMGFNLGTGTQVRQNHYEVLPLLVTVFLGTPMAPVWVLACSTSKESHFLLVTSKNRVNDTNAINVINAINCIQS